MPNDNNANTFVGLNFSNLRTLLRGVSINGMPMQRQEYGYWVIESPGEPIPLRPPYNLVLEGVNNQRLAVRIAALVAQDLGVNFDV